MPQRAQRCSLLSNIGTRFPSGGEVFVVGIVDFDHLTGGDVDGALADIGDTVGHALEVVGSPHEQVGLPGGGEVAAGGRGVD